MRLVGIRAATKAPPEYLPSLLGLAPGFSPGGALQHPSIHPSISHAGRAVRSPSCSVGVFKALRTKYLRRVEVETGEVPMLWMGSRTATCSPIIWPAGESYRTRIQRRPCRTNIAAQPCIRLRMSHEECLDLLNQAAPAPMNLARFARGRPNRSMLSSIPEPGTSA
ncbi:uncharacterized protein BO80DRAFT_133733 [Aspergillus ibericus CBS 121593]|uniref:Uncharacterized protein n=1 Tax=Aspergillus ibericus CBS 121593 TaxID=1448316 RepID=A0A395HBL9_9EURO|nr:hypothetical protein BO80DRAFT_133733 [Aspergillus ibericus CBS 121593]RAL05307.1 hypothetical protein BO80DRAFT_133733 [Aspergillus ibericus CBS 121593]